MLRNDKAYVWDMLQAAREIVEFVSGMVESEFSVDRKTRYAVERQLIVIGEAAHHLSDEFKVQNPDIPWSKLIALRNIIAHEYGEILVERIWNISQSGVPELLNQLQNCF